MAYVVAVATFICVSFAVEIFARYRAAVERERRRLHRRIAQRAAWDTVLIQIALRRDLARYEDTLSD
jgi:hypothetical protein